MAESGTESEGLADPDEELGEDEAGVVHRWKLELDAARKGPYKRWMTRAKKSVRRYRDEDMDNEDAGLRKRNAQFNVLWSNVQTVAPSTYSRAPKPVAERRYLDRDVIARAGATILQRSLSYAIEDSGLHETMMQCRTDFFLVGIGSAWLRYQAVYDETAPQHQTQELPDLPNGRNVEPMGGQAYAGAAASTAKVTEQKVYVDYCHWSDFLVSACRFWSERTWEAKRAYYSRKQLRKLCKDKETADAVPLKATRGKRENDVTDMVREVIGKAEVWQIWDIEAREVIWICEDYGVRPLKHVTEDKLDLSCFVPSARPVRATTTNDSFWPIPDYAIWHDQAAELDNLTARIAALTRAIKAVGVYDASQPELERLLMEGSENKLYGVKNWAKLVQRGGLDGSVGLLPIKEMADALTALYMARAQVKNDLDEISGVSDIVRGASDPNETAAAQKMKGQFSGVRGGDRKNEFNRFVRDTLLIMAEIMLNHFTDDMLWLMSDFEQWAKDQDLRAYAEPMMGHNGGPLMPLDAPAQPMAPMPAPFSPTTAAPAGMPGLGTAAPGGGMAPAAAPPMQAPQPPMQPPVPGIPLPHGVMPPQPQPQQPPAPPQINARQLFDEALDLLRKDKLRSFRIQVETNSTIEPDASEEKQARVEFLGAVTQFLAQAQEMAVAYPMVMPVLGKMLLFGARGFQVGRELESALESLITDLETQARNPKPKPPSPDEIKAKAAQQKGEMDMAKGKMDAESDQARMQLEMQKIQLELQATKDRLEMEMAMLREKMQMEMQMLREKMAAEQQSLNIKAQSAQIDGAVKEREAQLAMETQAADHQAEAETREGEMDMAREGLDVQREGLALKRQAAQDKAKSDKAKATAGAR